MVAYFKLILVMFLFSGCGVGIRNPMPDSGGFPKGPKGAGGDAATPFEHIAYWGSGVAGLAVLIGIILLWSKPKLGQQVIVTAISVLIGAQLMLWISSNLWWISIITLILGLAYVSYKHRDKIIDVFDDDDETEIITKQPEAIP